jgi:hypothetical protein
VVIRRRARISYLADLVESVFFSGSKAHLIYIQRCDVGSTMYLRVKIGVHDPLRHADSREHHQMHHQIHHQIAAVLLGQARIRTRKKIQKDARPNERMVFYVIQLCIGAPLRQFLKFSIQNEFYAGRYRI